ncbi:MAG: phosphoribosylanthranilate isomerase [Synechococcus sp.]|nr:phosphoribosylanthranilate isomerase [Synechococcus sp.]
MSQSAIAVKICGLTTPEQADAVASLGARAIGVIGVQASPRFVDAPMRRELFQHLEKHHPSVDRVWVVADQGGAQLADALRGKGVPSVVQLHGNESPETCAALRSSHPKTRWWKALRVREPDDLEKLKSYGDCIDALLLDAWSPEQLGGTGHRLDLRWLEQLEQQLPDAMPWWLAGGISAEWIPELLAKVKPYGLDASSRLELKPGVKDLAKVADLLQTVKAMGV